MTNPLGSAGSTPEFPVLEIGLMPQQQEVVDPADDWTGLTSARERRKRQNRLNQRIYRKRRAPGSSLSPPTTCPPGEASPPFVPAQFLLPMHEEPRHRRWARVSEQTNGSSACGIPGPLPLPMVIQLNTFNALAYNASLLRIEPKTLCDGKTLSPFLGERSHTVDESCPSTLQPTVAQQTMDHHPWIDLLPLPRMRDNLIRALPILDERDIGTDIVSVMGVVGEKPTLLVWGDPSNPRSWETSPAFLLKWGFLLRGCQELIEATNHWRERRGERPFRIDVS